MLSLHPHSVSLLGVDLTNVDAVAVDRRSSRQTEERTDLGPHLAFADVPEQRVTITISRTLAHDDTSPFRPGAMGELRFASAPSAADGRRRTYIATVVLLAVEHDFPSRAGARQRLSLLALSPDGAADPITEHAISP